MAAEQTSIEPGAVVKVVLDGLGGSRDLDEIAGDLRRVWDEPSGFQGDLLLGLAAEAFRAVGATPQQPLPLDRIDERFLPECPARGNVGHQKRRHTVHSAVLLAAGASPEDIGWWTLNDLYLHAFHAVVIFVRAAADRRKVPVEAICAELADVSARRAG